MTTLLPLNAPIKGITKYNLSSVDVSAQSGLLEQVSVLQTDPEISLVLSGMQQRVDLGPTLFSTDLPSYRACYTYWFSLVTKIHVLLFIKKLFNLFNLDII